MNLRDYARQQQSPSPAPAVLDAQAGTEQANPRRTREEFEREGENTNSIAVAQKIIKEYRLNHEISEGCRLQILKDLERKENPYKLLLIAAEAIGRLDFKGDNFYFQVKNKLIEIYGSDISEE